MTGNRTHNQARVVAALLLAFVWVGPPVVAWAIGIPHGYVREAFISGTTTLLTCLMVAGFWRWIRETRINRVLFGAVAMSPYLASVILLGCWLADVPDATAVALRTFAFVCMTTMAMVLGDWRLLPGALAFLIAFLGGCAYPGQSAILLGLANLFVVINAMVIYLPASLGLEER